MGLFKKKKPKQKEREAVSIPDVEETISEDELNSKDLGEVIQAEDPDDEIAALQRKIDEVEKKRMEIVQKQVKEVVEKKYEPQEEPEESPDELTEEKVIASFINLDNRMKNVEASLLRLRGAI